ncbi:uncharacterized protein EHS24_009553 [Apiotrichum porosum]|uniref:ATP synthase subunit K, mitochondrial n=1 Tax=Apiotrichum porosum TaxID=105984 RepID=A0A427XME5_9TREE|nr:uncharacterized protein EHS24_009553 [Apiotrichum porosum]RSH79887.1 hypothetical protein EHS24_009553 [Apiotrichum porosum]
MSYNIAGKAIKNEYIALGTIFTTIGIALASSGGGDKKVAAAPAPVAKDTTINTGSKEEDEFIRAFVAAAEEKPAAH